MDFKLLSAISAAKITKTGIRITGGGGTAAPGLVANYLDANTLSKLAKYYKKVVLVTGTNGKTTTSRLVGSILHNADIDFIHNRAGSNLLRGLSGAMIDNYSVFNSKLKKVALLEVDEAVLPEAANQTQSKILVFNNLFRDQLDRYGEVDKLRKLWQKFVSQASRDTILVLNSDDHSVAHLAKDSKARPVYFGIEDPAMSLGKLPHAADFTACISCGGELSFDQVYLSHLGRYKCESCGMGRPKPDVYAKKIYLDEDIGFLAEIVTPKGEFELRVKLPGLYNVYNTLSAIATALVLGVDLEVIKTSLQKSAPAFGRTEKLKVNGKNIFIFLVKNPAGFNEILRTVFHNKSKRKVLFAINDLLADGTDVSWLWDVDFENIATKIKKATVSGLRADDMVLRLKYTGAKIDVASEKSLSKALNQALEETGKDETLYIMPTYTAMLELKKILSSAGVSKNFWED